MRLTVLAVLACLAVTGCSDDGAVERPERDPVGPSSAAPSGEPTATPKTVRKRRPVTVPDVVAVELRSAREWLAGERLTVRADVRRDCRLLQGVVVAQAPAPGTRVSRGSEVTLTFGRSPAAATCARPPAQPLRRAFLAWATGHGGPPAFAPHVRLLQGNVEVARLTATEARDHDAWRLPAGYAELDERNLLDWMDDQVLLQPSRGLSAYCLQRAAPLPQDLVDRLRWSATLLTASADACLQVAAVQVWVDDESRISVVGFLRGSP